MSLTIQDQPTFPPNQLKECSQSEMYGFDGTVWRRITVNSSGAIIIDGGASQNQPTFAQGQLIPAAAGTGEQLSPGQAVPNGFAIFGRAFPDNDDTVYIGKSKANAEDPTIGSPLEPGAYFTMKLTDVSAIWVNSLTTGDGVFWYVEAAS